MNVREAIAQRRSVKKFVDRPVSRTQLLRLLDAAVLAPNHRLTQPWRFYALGPQARRAYGEVLGGRKARKVEDPAAAALVRAKVADEHAALPAMIVVAVREDPDPEVREEDLAAVMMAVENLLLAALEDGLGTHIKTGAVMQDPAARAAVGVAADERIVAVVNVGVAEQPGPPAKPRIPASELTRWTE
ncbi:MAG: nitroreductase [Gemmatimonadetes bacterium]|nr:nitroreductase [Gemmatimonadota bacterium]